MPTQDSTASQKLLFDAEEATDPISLFHHWFEIASTSEPNDPNAMSLATATPNGYPSVRMVLMKRCDDAGFAFYTNVESQKGRELLENPHAALCFHWKSLRRQVRIEGSVRDLPAEDADAYFHSRSRRSQLGAVASQQSRPLASRADLEAAAAVVAARYPESQATEIPRPQYWRGFLVWPERIEFWQDGPDRLHDRVVFTRAAETWTRTRLYP
jgi:pyridoxamine 5'-phosphate oxidase